MDLLENATSSTLKKTVTKMVLEVVPFLIFRERERESKRKIDCVEF